MTNSYVWNITFKMYEMLIFNINNALLVLYLVIFPNYSTPHGVKSLAPVRA
jgi:hypothetical protein